MINFLETTPTKNYLCHITTPKYRGWVKISTDMPAGRCIFSTLLTTLLCQQPGHTQYNYCDHTVLLHASCWTAPRNQNILNPRPCVSSITDRCKNCHLHFIFLICNILKYKTKAYFSCDDVKDRLNLCICSLWIIRWWTLGLWSIRNIGPLQSPFFTHLCIYT